MMSRAHADPNDVAELLRLQVEALFTHDPAGRIVSKNKPVYAPAPRIFIGRSPAGNLWRLRDDVPDDVAAILIPFFTREPVPERLDVLPTIQSQIVAEIARHAPITEVYSGPAWWLPERLPPPTRAVLIRPQDVDALRPLYPVTAENFPAIAPCAGVIEDGVAVSICFSARRSAAVAEAGLDTFEAARGRGYGSDAVAAWAAAVRATGRLPLYSTSWDNIPSRRVAAKLGAIQYGIDLSIY